MQSKPLGFHFRQVLLAMPVGLLAGVAVCDIVATTTDSLAWWLASYWVMAGGLVLALLAMPFSLVDWLGIRDTARDRVLGSLHIGGNVLAPLLFLVSWVPRTPGQVPDTAALALGIGGVIMYLLTASLGGEPETPIRSGKAAHASF